LRAYGELLDRDFELGLPKHDRIPHQFRFRQFDATKPLIRVLLE
jgi:hypothetical protein